MDAAPSQLPPGDIHSRAVGIDQRNVFFVLVARNGIENDLSGGLKVVVIDLAEVDQRVADLGSGNQAVAATDGSQRSVAEHQGGTDQHVAAHAIAGIGLVVESMDGQHVGLVAGDNGTAATL